MPNPLLFSAHISYGKRKYLNQSFFYKIRQAPNLYLTLRVFPIEINSHKFSFVRFVGDYWTFLVDLKDTRVTQKYPPKLENLQKFPIFTVFTQFLSNFDELRGLKC